MAAPKLVSDEVLLEAYSRLGSVWKVADEVGFCGQSVHERLTKLNAIKSNFFTEKDRQFLRENYLEYRNNRKLDELAQTMGRLKTSICREAKKLGLTDIKQNYREKRIVVDAMGYAGYRGDKKHGCRHVHRVVAEKMIGRKLRPDEVVHHIDRDKTNNDPSNLQVMTKREHAALHAKAEFRRKKVA